MVLVPLTPFRRKARIAAAGLVLFLAFSATAPAPVGVDNAGDPMRLLFRKAQVLAEAELKAFRPVTAPGQAGGEAADWVARVLPAWTARVTATRMVWGDAAGVPCLTEAGDDGLRWEFSYRACDATTWTLENATRFTLRRHAEALRAGGHPALWDQAVTAVEQSWRRQRRPPPVTPQHWETVEATGDVSARAGHRMVATDRGVFVFGGVMRDLPDARSGFFFDEDAQTWREVSRKGAPLARRGHLMVWTGKEVIVWGGRCDDVPGPCPSHAYDPEKDEWRVLSEFGGPPDSYDMTATWTGREMIVIGEMQAKAYDPAKDSWRALPSPFGMLLPTRAHSAVWTGSRLLVFGGVQGIATVKGEGFSFDPATQKWTALPQRGAPSARAHAAAVWDGGGLIVFGGCTDVNCQEFAGDGARWDAARNEWQALSPAGAPSARGRMASAWTGDLFLVWGGLGKKGSGTQDWGDGATYDVVTGRWTPLATEHRLSARHDVASVWTGRHWFLWGGAFNVQDLLDDGALLTP